MAQKIESVKNPFTYLRKDHEKLLALANELDSTTEQARKTRETVFAKFKEAVTLHSKAEEKCLYPILEEVAKTHELTMEGYEEHHVVDLLMKELSKLPVTTEEWSAKLSVLLENLKHHIEEEEKSSGLFARAERELSEKRTQAIGSAMTAFLSR